MQEKKEDREEFRVLYDVGSIHSCVTDLLNLPGFFMGRTPPGTLHPQVQA
jgi:hypothetical protein